MEYSILSYPDSNIDDALDDFESAKVCQACGKSFLPYGKRNVDRLKYCNRIHYRICPICGAEFTLDLSTGLDCAKKACSRACANKLRKQGMENTLLREHGVTNPGQLADHRDKVAQTCKRKYGVSSYSQSEEFKQRAKETWANKTEEEMQARLQKSIATNQERYGVDNGGQSDQAKQKQIETNRKRFGVDWYRQTEECDGRIRQTLKSKYGDEVYFRTQDYHDKVHQTSLSKYGVDHFTQSGVVKQHMRESILAKYGVTCVLQTEESRRRLIESNRRKYGVDYLFSNSGILAKSHRTMQSRYGVNHGFQSRNIQESAKTEMERKYGSRHAGQVESIRQKIIATSKLDERKEKYERSMIAKYGVSNPMHSIQLRSKNAKNRKNCSNLEIRLHHMLENYGIEYETEYVLTHNGHTHSFDVYLPKYRLLIEVDGSYYHAYDEDPDGKRCRDDYEDVRLHCVPKDHMYFVLVESDFERELRRLQKVLVSLDEGIFEYDSEIFNWCRTVGFPYYDYSDEYLRNQFIRLIKYNIDEYRPGCEIGISLVNQFHRSIFDCHVGNHVSVRSAWEDDILLKKVIANRLVYQNNVMPSKVLAGFNISKVAPKVSVFNPVLAKYLTEKYLIEYDTVFDPFSGFSGRLLGVVSTGKQYIGQDLNSTVIQESQNLIEFLGLNPLECFVNQRNLFDSSGTFPCLLTCPPYGSKEIYNDEHTFMSCDEWITECLSRFDCERYVFVVDESIKYKHNIVEEIRCKSHFRRSPEYVILIDV